MIGDEKALRELDAEVHRVVFGRHCTFDMGDLWDHDGSGYGDESEAVPRYSSRIEDAWKVLEEISSRGLSARVCLADARVGEVVCLIQRPKPDQTEDFWMSIDSDSVPLVICRCALNVIKGENTGKVDRVAR